MNDTAGDGGPTPDPDSVRALVLGLLDRIEHFAATVISDRPSAAGFDPHGDPGSGVRMAVDTIIGEVGEFLNNLIAAVIAVLEAISAALDEAMGARTRTSPGRPTSSRGGFQPITVDVEMGEPQQ